MLSVISRLTSCATRVCCACVDLITCVAVRYLTLRTGCEKHGRKNPLPYSFSERSHVGNLRQIRKQGKGRSSKRKGNRRCPFLFAPAAGAALSRAPQSATLRLISSEYLPPVRGEPVCGSSCSPVIRCRKKEPSGRLPSPRQAVKFPLDIPQSPTTILLRKRSN